MNTKLNKLKKAITEDNVESYFKYQEEQDLVETLIQTINSGAKYIFEELLKKYTVKEFEILKSEGKPLMVYIFQGMIFGIIGTNLSQPDKCEDYKLMLNDYFSYIKENNYELKGKDVDETILLVADTMSFDLLSNILINSPYMDAVSIKNNKGVSILDRSFYSVKSEKVSQKLNEMIFMLNCSYS